MKKATLFYWNCNQAEPRTLSGYAVEIFGREFIVHRHPRYDGTPTFFAGWYVSEAETGTVVLNSGSETRGEAIARAKEHIQASGGAAGVDKAVIRYKWRHNNQWRAIAAAKEAAGLVAAGG